MNPTNHTLLIVDDDHDIGIELKHYLEPHGYKVWLATHGQQMWKQLKTHNVDLVVLDIMLPGTDGISLCQQLRQQSAIPILMLSAAGSEADRVSSLEIGADDFMAKPFSARELLARIKALLRRSSGMLGAQRAEASQTHMPMLQFADWRLDRSKRCLLDANNVSITLSQREFQMLNVLLEHAGRVLTRDQLLEYTRGLEASPFDRSIDVLIGRLRKKIERDPKNPQLILTVRGGGYQLKAVVKKL